MSNVLRSRFRRIVRVACPDRPSIDQRLEQLDRPPINGENLTSTFFVPRTPQLFCLDEFYRAICRRLQLA